MPAKKLGDYHSLFALMEDFKDEETCVRYLAEFDARWHMRRQKT
jgi:hypothetical protein